MYMSATTDGLSLGFRCAASLGAPSVEPSSTARALQPAAP
jgi:hypothetical protein